MMWNAVHCSVKNKNKNKKKKQKKTWTWKQESFSDVDKSSFRSLTGTDS